MNQQKYIRVGFVIVILISVTLAIWVGPQVWQMYHDLFTGLEN